MRMKCVSVLLALTLAGLAAAIWVEPNQRGSLVASSSTFGSQHAGTPVTFNCTSSGLRDTQNIYWRHQKGSWVTDTFVRGRAPLAYTRELSRDDANTLVLCDALYMSRPLGTDEDDYTAPLRTYRAASAALPLQVAAAIPTTPRPAVAAQAVEVTSDKPLTSLRVGEEVMISCRIHNLVSRFIDVFQVKDGLELDLGLARRWEVEPEDDATLVYCRAWDGGAFIVSPRLRLTVLN